MSFFAHDRWIWDFWIADDGRDFHLYYLSAPKALGDANLRHRNATIGHAVGTDLMTWVDHGPVITAGETGSFDGTATWTGSVLRELNGRWRMFYTGSRFLDPDRHTNIETVGAAVSDDLYAWEKVPGPVLTADSGQYETLADGTWHEEAWRDPWVSRDGDGWKMLLTARARPEPHATDPRDAGVVGIATSRDLAEWVVQPPASNAGAGFAHLEVLQPFTWNSMQFVLFSCDTAHLAGHRRARGDRGGVWVAPVVDGHYEIESARLLVDERLYAGKVVRGRDGATYFMGFVNSSPAGAFDGTISDPIPVLAGEDGWPVIGPEWAATAAGNDA